MSNWAVKNTFLRRSDSTLLTPVVSRFRFFSSALRSITLSSDSLRTSAPSTTSTPADGSAIALIPKIPIQLFNEKCSLRMKYNCYAEKWTQLASKDTARWRPERDMWRHCASAVKLHCRVPKTSGSLSYMENNRKWNENCRCTEVTIKSFN